MNQHIATYTDRAGAYQADVTLVPHGTYAISIFDLDAAERLPFAVHLTTEAAARAYAQKCMTNDDDEELPL